MKSVDWRCVFSSNDILVMWRYEETEMRVVQGAQACLAIYKNKKQKKKYLQLQL